MIARIRHGRVPAAKPEAYGKFVTARAIPDYRSVPGNMSVHVLEREQGDATHFITLTFWESFEAVRGFARNDVESAKYFSEDKDYLREFEPTGKHYRVVGGTP